MKYLLINLIAITFLLNSCVQTQNSKQNNEQDNTKDIAVGGVCDRCETMYEGMPAFENIHAETTIANATEPGERMEISGRVFMPDAKMPAKNIIVYLYHTNAKGLYAASDSQTTGKLHGHLRGWVKTNEEGNFKFYTIRPAPYPQRNIPAHLHLLIKEPGKTLYYIDEVWFDDDTLVTKDLRDKTEKRGGDMIIHPEKDQNNVWKGNIVIMLGLNIPGYK